MFLSKICHTLNCGKKLLFSLLFTSFQHKKILKSHINDFFKINGIQIPKEGEHVTFKNYERKTNLAFTIYAGFESILAVENNGKQNPDKFYTNKYQKNSACNKSFKSSYEKIMFTILLMI